MGKKDKKFYKRMAVLLLIIYYIVVMYGFDLLSFLSDNAYYIAFSCTILGFGIMAGLLFYKMRTDKVKTVLFQWAYLGWMLLGFFVFLFWNILTSYFFGGTQNGQALSEVSQSLTGFAYILQFIVYPILIAPLSEEFIFRGLIMTLLEKYRRYYLDVLLSAAAFGVLHVITHGWVTTDFIRYFGGGLILSCLFHKTRAIQYPIGLHIIWNAFTVLLSHLIS